MCEDGAQFHVVKVVVVRGKQLAGRVLITVDEPGAVLYRLFRVISGSADREELT